MFSRPGLAVLAAWIPDPVATARLKLEYEGNNYQQDFAGKLEQKRASLTSAPFTASPIGPTLTYERGSTFMFWRRCAISTVRVS